jgi:prepilin peptidase CpaA
MTPGRDAGCFFAQKSRCHFVQNDETDKNTLSDHFPADYHAFMTHLVLFLLLAGAVFTDQRSHKIYNRWLLPGGIAGILLSFIRCGPVGLREALISAFLAFVILFPVYLFGGIGAGDVKLFAAVSTCLSFEDVFLCIFCSFLVAGVISIIRILQTRSLHQTIRFALPVFVSILFIYGGKL